MQINFKIVYYNREVISLVTIDYILIGVAVLLAILDVVMSIIHFKPQNNVEAINLDKSVNTQISNDNDVEVTKTNNDVTPIDSNEEKS